jgi:MFS family permease
MFHLPPALHSRDFRLFWTGLVLSSLGTQFTQVAMLWQIYLLTGSPLQTGLLGLARAIPQMSLMLFGGLLADAVDRRKLLMVTQAAQFCVSASLTVLTIAGAVTPVVLYVASAALALFSALETPTRNSVVPNLVPREHLTSALALNASQRQIGSVAGPSIAGILLAVFGPAPCYLVDTLSWVAMLGSLLRIKGATQLRTGRGRMSVDAVAEGLRFVRANPILLWMMALDFGANLFGSNRALLPIYAQEILRVGASGLGLMFTATAIGSIAAGGLMSVLPPIRRAGVWVLIGIGVYGACTAVFAVSPYFWLSLVMLAGTGIGNAVSTILRNVIYQMATPDELRGRVASVNGLFTQGGPQLGQVESGVVADLAGTEFSALSGGVATVLMVVLAYAVPMIRDCRNPVHVEPVAARA